MIEMMLYFFRCSAALSGGSCDNGDNNGAFECPLGRDVMKIYVLIYHTNMQCGGPLMNIFYDQCAVIKLI